MIFFFCCYICSIHSTYNILKDSAFAKNVFNPLLKKFLKRKMDTFYVSNQCCHLKAICFSVCAESIDKAAKSVSLRLSIQAISA